MQKESKAKSIILFNQQKIRRQWDDEKELWYFSVVDVIAALTGSVDPFAYWRKLKERLKNEGGNETVTKCHALKMPAADGKMRLTDTADTQVMLRLIQSIPSPNAEPFKLWLSQVGYERLEETADPELAINRALKTYLRKGYTPEWVNQRLKSIEIRKALTDEWGKRGVNEGIEFAILTDEITQAWAGLTTKQYKNLKDLKKENLRDNMTNLELVLNMLAETATTEISEKRTPKTFHQNKRVAKEGGTIAGTARKQIEKKSGRKVVNSNNFRTMELRKGLKKNKYLRRICDTLQRTRLINMREREPMINGLEIIISELESSESSEDKFSAKLVRELQSNAYGIVVISGRNDLSERGRLKVLRIVAEQDDIIKNFLFINASPEKNTCGQCLNLCVKQLRKFLLMSTEIQLILNIWQ